MLTLEQIIRSSLRGIGDARGLYKNWSGGCDLREAPEYMVTTAIARSIVRTALRANCEDLFLTLESNIRSTMDSADAHNTETIGAFAAQEKFDIALWEHWTPIGVVEVKNNPLGFGTIEADLVRICEILGSRNSFCFGLIVYYRMTPNGHHKPARDRLVHRMNSINNSATQFTESWDSSLNVRLCRGQVRVVNDEKIAWSSACIAISR